MMYSSSSTFPQVAGRAQYRLGPRVTALYLLGFGIQLFSLKKLAGAAAKTRRHVWGCAAASL